MGAILKTVATSVKDSGSSYMDLGSEVLRQCLENGLGDNENLDLLINTGIYPDDHIHEPAFASLIQGRLSLSHRERLSATFSFDLHNGGGGSLMALGVISGFIESGKIQYGAVVAGDSRPSGCQAGAVLIGKGAPAEGFQAFSQDSYTQYSEEYESYSNYTGKELETIINQKDTYLGNCLLCVEKSVEVFLSDRGLGMEEIDLLISSQNPAGFASGLVDLYGKEKLNDLNKKPSCYSAGLFMALGHSKGVFDRCGKILFINVGPGIIVDLALYENPRGK